MTVGAAQNTVTPWRSTRRRMSSPSILRSITCSIPIAVAASGTPQPLTWNCGSVCR